MSYRKFKPNDILLNTMKTYPSCEFLIFDGRVYYNNITMRSGAIGPQVPITGGFISLYEYNVDRNQHQTLTTVPPWGEAPDVDSDGDGFNGTDPYDEGIIYPFITKDSARSSFKTAGKASYNNEFQYGDILTENYPLSASITREFMYYPAGTRTQGLDDDTDGAESFDEAPLYRHYYALKNRLNFYGLRSVHHKVIGTASMGGAVDRWNKDDQQINLISIPSIFYGTKIKPGSVSLKTYYTGALAGELRDSKRNGELIQVANSSEHATSLDGKVAGVVLYEEGFILLTGSWDLSPTALPITTGSSDADDQLKWIYFGAGAQDSVTQATAGTNYKNASLNLSFICLQ